ncbi:unnamed protein product [Xylocopa violacea]|uniref:Uncharacterized protein n=1 Tax=Xylocopa violacea TaxID=135666 RepID=A0ABP1NG18_XYLVO
MGTMRDNFAAVFLLLVPMLSTSESLSLRGNENSSERNSSPDALTLDPPSTPSTTYECLFMDPSLPICDAKWMLSSGEDSTSNRNLFNKDVRQRSKRNIDVSTMDVIVYTFEGCLLPRLPFSMPSCDGISLNRIVDIQKFRPFAVKELTKPPFVFPKFNYSEWLRTITRLKNHVSPTTRDGRMEELMNAATTKETMPNAMAASMNSSNGSSANKFIPGGSKHPESVEQFQERTEETLNDGRVKPPASSSSSSVEIPSVLQFRDRFSSMESDGNESRDRSKPVHLLDQTNGAISTIPLIPRNRIIDEQSVDEEEPSNSLEVENNSRELFRLPPNIHANKNYSPLTEASPGIFRRRREVSSPVSEETRAREIGSQSVVRRTRHTGKDSSSKRKFQFVNFGKHKKRAKGFKSNQPRVVTANTFETAIPWYKKDSNSRNKIDASSDSKTTWRRSVSKGATSTKMDRTANRVELPSSRSQ